MGIGPAALELYASLAKEGVMCCGQSVCELGSQDFVPEEFPVEYLYSAFGVAPPQYMPASGRAFMERLGCHYDCIDLDGRHGALRLDLNRDTANAIGRRYDVVTNHGTSEHIFDQTNCFCLIHDLTVVGGLMIHIVPHNGPGQGSHGLYLYGRDFFPDLASANGYVILRQRMGANQLGEYIVAVLRKTKDRGFVQPIQAVYGYLR